MPQLHDNPPKANAFRRASKIKEDTQNTKRLIAGLNDSQNQKRINIKAIGDLKNL
ncbi:MAG: hypothetical protein Q8P07_03730 [bacterium]|nr:hypothetical protein [bacterium]